MSEYPRLTEMGVQNPQEIEKFAVYTVGNTDVLRIIYDRKPGSLLPVSRRYKFPQVKKSVMVDSGTDKAKMMYESSGAFREALSELERLKTEREKGQDVAALIREEIRHLEEDIALRTQYINSLIDRL
jgi:hypothetical protein